MLLSQSPGDADVAEYSGKPGGLLLNMDPSALSDNPGLVKRLAGKRAALRQRRAKAFARLRWRDAKRCAKTLIGGSIRFLRLCLAQIRGGRIIIKRGEVYYLPLWLPIAIALLLASTLYWGDIGRAAWRLSSAVISAFRPAPETDLAAFFAPAVQAWSDDIVRWSARHEADPHLLATVMQIESCGHPTVVSNAGAQGLFQVMPFHFAAGESMLDPNTNAKRGASFLNYCHAAAGGVIGLALACYNGGPSVINQARENWSFETRKYYRWGVGIYSDAVAGNARSETLDQWLAAGGDRLCASALNALRANPRPASET